MLENFPCLNISHALAMTSKMEYLADSPLTYDVEGGELGSGLSSPGTIRENASECSTQTDDYNDTMTTRRADVNN